MMTATRDNVERWLVHEGLKFRYLKGDDIFRIVISSAGDRYEGVEVFEPRGQPGVIVVGRKCPFGPGQNARFLNMTAPEQHTVRERVASYCDSIGAVHRFLVEDGLNMVGVYIVIDAKERQNQSGFSESLPAVCEMADRLKVHLRRTV